MSHDSGYTAEIHQVSVVLGQLQSAVAELRSGVSGAVTDYRQRFDRLDSTIGKRLATLEQAVARFEERQLALARDLDRHDSGGNGIRELGRIVATLESRATTTDGRIKSLERRVERVVWWIAGAGAAAGGLAGGVAQLFGGG